MDVVRDRALALVRECAIPVHLLMPRLWSIIIFVAIGTSVLGGMHYYIWRRLVRGAAIREPWRKRITLALIVLCLSLPLSIVLSRSLPPTMALWWLQPGLIWLGTSWLLFAAVVCTDLIRGAAWTLRKLGRDVDVGRRQALERLLGLAATVLGGGAAGYALVEGTRIHAKHVEVSLGRLPPELDGMRIVQLTDVHIGPTLGKEFLQRVVALANDLKPDLVAITGDLVDGKVSELSDAISPLTQLRSRFGTFFVTGNHEYYSGAEEWCEHLSSLGIGVLRNQRARLGPPEACIELVGVNDYHAGRYGTPADLAAALRGCTPTAPVVLLAHQPRAAFQADELGVDLQLSGHTHGGQLWPFNWLVRLQQPVVAGLEQVGRTLVYVSCGTGHWGPPMRLAAPAEVTCLTLRAGSQGAPIT